MGGDHLAWLSQWYLSHCDGDWEHSYGIKIGTLDNPGWSLRINLNGTTLNGRHFDALSHGEPADDLEELKEAGSWWIARLDGDTFEAFCGPLDLSAVIGVFRNWTEQAV